VAGMDFDSLIRSIPPSGNRRGALAALLGGALGARNLVAADAKNKKKQRKKNRCPCPGGRVRLLNGSCANVGAVNDDCPALCVCRAFPSAEGGFH
jgi:hypothetical protein